MKMYSATLRFLIHLTIILCIVSTVASQEATPTSTPVPPDDLVHFGDVIDVDVVGGFEFDWRGKLTTEGFLDGFDSYGEPIAGLCRSEEQIVSRLECSLITES